MNNAATLATFSSGTFCKWMSRKLTQTPTLPGMWNPCISYASADEQCCLPCCILCRRFVWVDEQGADTNSYPAGRVEPLSAPPKIGDGTPHGAYFWSQVRKMVFRLLGVFFYMLPTTGAIWGSIWSIWSIWADNFNAEQDKKKRSCIPPLACVVPFHASFLLGNRAAWS